MKYLNFGFIFLILGSIIGAGFASGKEIQVFFSGFGFFGIFIIFLSSVFLFFVLKNLINLGKIAKTSNIKIVNKMLFKDNSKFFDWFIQLGLFIFLTAMVAGVNSIGDILFSNINFPILTIVSLFFSIFIVLNGFEAIKKLNLILMPIVVIFIIFVAISGIFVSGANNVSGNLSFGSFFKYLMLGLFYVCYNIVFSSSIIFEKSKDFSKKQININCFLISLIFGLLVLIVNFAMQKQSVSLDMPMLFIAFGVNKVTGYLFAVILWFSILTSLISSLYMLINSFKVNKLLSCSIFLTCSFIFSLFGFSKIVNFIYPLEGVVCLIFIFKVFLFNKFRSIKTTKKVLGFYVKSK